MIIDTLSEFASAKVIPVTAETKIFGAPIDLQRAGALWNPSGMFWHALITTSVTSAGAATINFQLVSDSTETVAVNGTATLHMQTGVIGKADLVAGWHFKAPLPVGQSFERYLNVIAVVGTADLTAGAASTWIGPATDNWKAFPQAAGAAQ